MTIRPFRLLSAGLVGVLALGCSLLSVTPAAAVGPGYIRLAHLSPDTPKVDVYVESFRGGSFSTVLPGVGYGALSAYERVSPGIYTVAMRPPGAAKTSDPLLRTNVTVKSGRAYTVAGVGRNADISLRVLTDDLTKPAAGQARLRVVQASSAAPVVNVTTTEGTAIAENAQFPSTTAYAEVGAQRWTLRVEPQGGEAAPVEQAVRVQAGAIYTALVLDKGTTGVQLLVRTDAAGADSMPAGSVDTGLGGGIVGAAEAPAPGLLVVGALALLALGLVGAARLRGLLR